MLASFIYIVTEHWVSVSAQSELAVTLDGFHHLSVSLSKLHWQEIDWLVFSPPVLLFLNSHCPAVFAL